MMILTMLIYDDMNVYIRDCFRVWVDIVTFSDPLAFIVGRGTCIGWIITNSLKKAMIVSTIKTV